MPATAGPAQPNIGPNHEPTGARRALASVVVDPFPTPKDLSFHAKDRTQATPSFSVFECNPPQQGESTCAPLVL